MTDGTPSRYLAVGVALLAVAAIGVSGVMATNDNGMQDQRADSGGGGAFTFAVQHTDGETVTIDSVYLPEGGYVAIHNGSLLSGDATGSVIGVSGYLEPGVHRNVEIRLYDVPGRTFDQDALQANQTLIAMPHHETNDNKQYDFVATDGQADGPYTDELGQPIVDAALVVLGGGGGGGGVPIALAPSGGGGGAAGPQGPRGPPGPPGPRGPPGTPPCTNGTTQVNGTNVTTCKPPTNTTTPPNTTTPQNNTTTTTTTTTETPTITTTTTATPTTTTTESPTTSPPSESQPSETSAAGGDGASDGSTPDGGASPPDGSGGGGNTT
ncbi:MAG: hypothetical protein ABEJ31_00770 [Haloarculaceae archaeon]